MPLQNRVTPLGDVIVDPARGLVYGNRGCLHDSQRTIVRRFQVKRWIACRLEFKDRRRVEKQQPGRYTELFFLDEATAFAAGHRPCAECRRDDYNRFLEIAGETRAAALDEHLHEERVGPRHERPVGELPDGSFVLREGEPWLVHGTELLRWTPAGYTERRARSSGPVPVVTPPMLVEVLRAGWGGGSVPFLHPSAG